MAVRLVRQQLVALHVISSLSSFSTLATPATKYGVSFSPAGLMTPFHIGASTCLHDLGILTEECALSGSSGGALAAVTSALFVEMKDSLPMSPLEASVYVAQKCRDLGARGNLRNALDDVLGKLIPIDAHHKLNRRKTPVKVAFTALNADGFQAQFIESFTSKEDIIECLRASCNIPLYFNGNQLFVVARGCNAIDGFFSVDFRRFGCPPTGATTRELIICPYKAPFVNIDPYAVRPPNSVCEYDLITPHLLDDETWPFSFPQILQMSFTAPKSSLDPSMPISDDELRHKYNLLYKGGYEAVKRWYERSGQYHWGK